MTFIGAAGAAGRTLRFLANVDPVDVARALAGLDAESTLVIIVSKVCMYVCFFLTFGLFIVFYYFHYYHVCISVHVYNTYRHSPPLKLCLMPVP